MASSGSLKQKKCQVAIVSFKFSDGRPRLQQLKSLPEHQFEIPQKDGMTAPIPTKRAEEEVTALGFVNNLKNSGQHQIKAITSTMNSNPYLRRDDVQLSLSTQLHPRLKWSIACILSDPKKLDGEVHWFFYQTMSRIGVNKKLRKDSDRCWSTTTNLDISTWTLTISGPDSSSFQDTGTSRPH